MLLQDVPKEEQVNTREAAEAVGTDSKRLRRFLRSDPTYRNAGQGGRYEFTAKDIPTLKKRFAAWAADKPASGTSVASTTSRRRRKGEVEAMDVSIANRPAEKLTKTERERRDALSRERVDRLERALYSRGMHISQMRRGVNN